MLCPDYAAAHAVAVVEEEAAPVAFADREPISMEEIQAQKAELMRTLAAVARRHLS